MTAAARGVFRKDPQEKNHQLLLTFRDRIVIGSGEAAQLRLRDIQCSGVHALIEEDTQTKKLVLVDLGSRYGTYSSGERVQEKSIDLKEEFSIGPNVFFVDDVSEESKVIVTEPEIERRPRRTASAPVTKKTVLEVTLFWGEKTIEIQTFSENSVLTLGTQRDSTFHVALSDERLRKSPFVIARYKRGQLHMHLPVEASGLVWHGSEVTSIDTSRHKDQKTEEFSAVDLTLKEGDKAQIHFGELALLFKFVNPPPKDMINLVPKVDRVLLKTALAVTSVMLMLFLFLIFFKVPEKEKDLDDIPEHLKQVLYDAGIEDALKKQQSAIGHIAKTLEGGRARAEEGRASAQKTPKKPTPTRKSRQTRVKAPAKASGAPLDLNAAFSVSEAQEEVQNQDMVGETAAGNTAAALVGGNFARGTKGLGAGGGGQSVGIGALKGYSVGGGMGAGDIGLAPSKGRSIKNYTEDEIVILGGLDPEVIAEIIKRYLAQIQNCYEQQLTLKPQLKGKVTTSFIIGPAGTVKKVTIAESTLRDQPTERCIEERIMTWKFPQPKGGGTVGVKYPFLLMSNTGK